MITIREYLNFVKARLNAFEAKRQGLSDNDPITRKYKFTNVYRVLDRVSQYELKHVIDSTNDPLDNVMRVFLFNHFKTPFMWRLVSNTGLVPRYNQSSFDDLRAKLKSASQASTPLFTSAYVVPSAGKGLPKVDAVINKLEVLADNLRLEDLASSKTLFDRLRSIKGMGDFLASQVVFDLQWQGDLYQDLFILGVGAKEGAYKLGFLDTPTSTNADKAKECLLTLQGVLEEEKIGLYYDGDYIQPRLADVQNTLCEFNKYTRVSRPDVLIGGKNKKIKARYTPNLKDELEYVIPGWWVGKQGLVRL